MLNLINHITDYQFPGLDIVNIQDPYTEVFDSDQLKKLPSIVGLGDHLGGIDEHYRNPVLDKLKKSNTVKTVLLCCYPDHQLQKSYASLDLRYARDEQDRLLFSKFLQYQIHPELKYKTFLCSFNGSPHVSRKLLTAILHKFGWYNDQTVSKNFKFTVDVLDGHIAEYVPDETALYRKFFIGPNSEEFFNIQNSFGHDKYRHEANIYNVDSAIASSFVHVISETMATSYHPFITEKFLYSVVTRGLFVAWAQPGWHKHLEKHYGFKLYKNLFDYEFDTIKNPIKRLVALMSMLAKFSKLTPAEWHDLYLLELDAIEYNYQHYFSQQYLDCLKVDNTQKTV